MAKIILKKHQRVLISSFKKYQLDDLGKQSEKAKKVDFAEDGTLLGPSIQDDDWNGGWVADQSNPADILVDENLTDKQLQLLHDI